MPKKINEELKARAVRLVQDRCAEYSSLSSFSAAVAKQLGVGHESVRRWVLQDDIDSGRKDGITSEESVEIRRLKVENRRLTEDVAIVKQQRLSSRGSRPPASDDHGVH